MTDQLKDIGSAGYVALQWQRRADGAFVELGSYDYRGRFYIAQGALVSDDYLACYPTGETVGASVSRWDGIPLGRIVRVSSRPALWFGRRSWHASRYYFMRVRLDDGREYACRGFGAGMLARGRRVRAL